MTPVPDDLARNYRVAHLRSLSTSRSGPQETVLSDGYEIGRSAVVRGLSILEVAELHHEVFLDVLRVTPASEVTLVATASSAFFLEVLATYDMAQGALARPEGPPASSDR